MSASEKRLPRIKAGPRPTRQQAFGKKQNKKKNAPDIRMLEDHKVEEQENILLALLFASRREEKIRCQLQKPHRKQGWASARHLSTPGSCVGSRPDYVYAAKERPQSLSAISLRLFSAPATAVRLNTRVRLLRLHLHQTKDTP